MKTKTQLQTSQRPPARTYGEALRRLIDQTGETAYRLAINAGVSHASVSLILSDTRRPSAETLERLLRAAGQSWAWLDENMIQVRLPE